MSSYQKITSSSTNEGLDIGTVFVGFEKAKKTWDSTTRNKFARYALIFWIWDNELTFMFLWYSWFGLINRFQVACPRLDLVVLMTKVDLWSLCSVGEMASIGRWPSSTCGWNTTAPQDNWVGFILSIHYGYIWQGNVPRWNASLIAPLSGNISSLQHCTRGIGCFGWRCDNVLQAWIGWTWASQLSFVTHWIILQLALWRHWVIW